MFDTDDGVITIAPEAFEGLDDGEHEITAVYDDGEVNSVVITDQGVPLSAYIPEGAWSLFDLLMTILSVVLFVVCLAIKLNRKSEDDDEGRRTSAQRSNIREEEDGLQRKRMMFMLMSLAFAVINVILLFLTQDFTLPMIFFDQYSIIFGLVGLGSIIATIFMKRKKDEESDESHDDNFAKA